MESLKEQHRPPRHAIPLKQSSVDEHTPPTSDFVEQAPVLMSQRPLAQFDDKTPAAQQIPPMHDPDEQSVPIEQDSPAARRL
jgi:hypothetical protein